jgi:anti-sigma regulatory factor (Ser/Thr protein kinase)
MPKPRPDDLRIDILASPAAGGLARTMMEQRLLKWGILHISDDAFIVITEIVTNACEATPHRTITLHLRRDRSGVLIAVWDGSPDPPVIRPSAPLTLDTIDAAPDETWDHGGGWGLPLVRALSTDCGTWPEPTGGKWVWARLALP